MSPEIVKSFSAESGHWYSPDGSPAYTIKGANGAERQTTLRDAKKIGLFPSVTTILKAAAKPGLERWKAEQLLMSALTLPRLPGEMEKAWIGRVWEDSIQQAVKAAERGTAIHAAIECYLTDREYPAEFDPYVQAAMDAIRPLGQQKWSPEKSFAYVLGYGGKVDLHSPEVVLDFKTKDGDLLDVKCWDDHFMQVAAYARGLLLPNAGCGIVFVSRTEPKAKLVMHTREETQRGWLMFHRLLEYWQAEKNYSPGQ